MKFFKLSAIALLTGLFVLTGCEKDDDPAPNPEPTPTEPVEKTVNLTVRPMVGADALEIGTEYSFGSDVVSFDFCKFYMSGIELMDDAGDVLADNGGQPILVSPDATTVTIGTTTEDHLHMLRFDVGLDSITNHADPILAVGVLNDSQMHWNWNPMSGYKFSRMDYTLNGTDYQSHAAMDALFRPDVTVSVHDVVTTDSIIDIVINVDYGVLLNLSPLPASNNHGGTSYNTSLMDDFGSGVAFTLD